MTELRKKTSFYMTEQITVLKIKTSSILSYTHHEVRSKKRTSENAKILNKDYLFFKQN